MILEEVFNRVRPSIVAFCSKIAMVAGEDPPLIAPIIGTGFVVHEHGVVATNRHVAEEMLNLPRDPETGGLLAMALVFGDVQKLEDGYDLNAHFVEIVQLQMISSFSTSEEIFYGEQLPDVAFAQLAVRDLPTLSLARADWSIRVGMEIATAGFPLGEDPLVAYGLLGQGTPLLRRGIVSAVNPFPCPQPDAFTIDVMSQGGASGSPIFRTDAPEVVGILRSEAEEARSALTLRRTCSWRKCLSASLTMTDWNRQSNVRRFRKAREQIFLYYPKYVGVAVQT
jgi:hypothetical protein